MTLNVENPFYVRFSMEDGAKTVTVHVSASALKERARQDRRISENLALLYSAYREAIEAAASLKYDQSIHLDSADIVVVASDIF
jgi:hypothetical protein